jgi:dihydrofolate reductase
MKLVVGTFLSLDGVYQAPGDANEDTEGGFTQGGWQMPYFDDESGQIMNDNIARTEALLLGRKTYEIFAAYWPGAPADDPFAVKFNSVPKYVVSTTLQKTDWNNSHIIRGNIVEEVARLKQQPGDGMISVTGSGKLAQCLMENDLVDSYQFWINPLILGSGKRLFVNGIPPKKLKLVNKRIVPSGVAVLDYEPERA